MSGRHKWAVVITDHKWLQPHRGSLNMSISTTHKTFGAANAAALRLGLPTQIVRSSRLGFVGRLGQRFTVSRQIGVAPYDPETRDRARAAYWADVEANRADKYLNSHARGMRGLARILNRTIGE